MTASKSAAGTGDSPRGVAAEGCSGPGASRWDGLGIIPTATSWLEIIDRLWPQEDQRCRLARRRRSLLAILLGKLAQYRADIVRILFVQMQRLLRHLAEVDLPVPQVLPRSPMAIEPAAELLGGQRHDRPP